ncbi:MAG TPA: PAS domain S-box protein, partial [Pyrinomonadaceae bacterium]|nr:PAS domain S-box protein [Pyrinomonadaceae bacterium]
ALFMVALGLTVLAGWFSHTPALIQFGLQLRPMTRNAAACSLLGGLALLMMVLKGPRWLTLVCAGIVSTLCILTVVEFVFGVNVGIDDLLGPPYIPIRVSSPGRMAPLAAICFGLGSMGLMLIPRILTKRHELLLAIIGSIIAAAGIATCMAIALGSSNAFGWDPDTRVSLPAAVALWMFGLGMLALVWRLEPERIGTPRWLPISVAIGVATSSVGVWQALIADGYSPLALVPAVVLGGGCLMAPIFGLTIYQSQRAHKQAVALRQSEARKTAILDSALDCIMTIDHKGCITEFNPAAERTFGFNRNDVVGKELAEVIVPPSLRDQHRSGLARYLATGEARVLGRRVEMTAVRADGSEFPVELAITRIPTDGPPSFTGYLRDITERNRALEKLQANQELLDLAQRSAGAMAFDWYVQKEINYWSPEQEALFGLAPGSFDGTFKSWKKMMYAPDWPVVVDAIKHANQTGSVTAEYRVVWPDGSLHWLSTKGRMFFDSEGTPLRMVGFTSDVTPRKLVEEELRRSAAFLADAQQLTSIGSFSWLVTTDDLVWSDELYRIFEFERDRPVTLKLVGSRVHPEDIPVFHEHIARARADGNDVDFDFRLQMPDSLVKHMHVVAHRGQNENGQMEYIGAVQDVTERRLSEEALSEVRSELAHMTRVTSLGALTASIAHEVNQPLAGIITNAGTCLRMLDADPPNVDGARQTAQRTIRDGHRASDVITRLRALFSKRDATTEAVDLNEAIREVIALSRSELQRSQVISRLELADDLPQVTGDRVQLQQVVLNLLLNAADAMTGIDDHPRRLIVRTERDEGDHVRLSVQDAGVGFGPQGPEKLFEPFYTTKNGGMGIGLSVSRSIIESHHGRLWATPNDGPGATFSFSIPGAAAV